MLNKDNVLVFGANSYIGSSFVDRYSDKYEFTLVSRHKEYNHIYFDFLGEENLPELLKKIPNKISAVIFSQGLNPTVGINDMTSEHFIDMLKVNLITPALIIRGLEKKLINGGSFIFFSSVAKVKGSYDPSYASAKSGLSGLIYSLSKVYPRCRFNQISLGLVENSPVHKGMTQDFVDKHSSRMHQNQLIKIDNVLSAIQEMIQNKNMHLADIKLDGGYV